MGKAVSSETRQGVIEAIKSGMSSKEIALIAGVSIATVCRIKKSLEPILEPIKETRVTKFLDLPDVIDGLRKIVGAYDALVEEKIQLGLQRDQFKKLMNDWQTKAGRLNEDIQKLSQERR